MRRSITQESEFGCGIACYGFALRITYAEAAARLGEKQAHSTRFWVKDLCQALAHAGSPYTSRYVKGSVRRTIYKEGAIVLVRRSKHYPVGHYLIRHSGTWMDPWINLSRDKNIAYAKSGFRKRLPGAPMYVLLPVE